MVIIVIIPNVMRTAPVRILGRGLGSLEIIPAVSPPTHAPHAHATKTAISAAVGIVCIMAASSSGLVISVPAGGGQIRCPRLSTMPTVMPPAMTPATIDSAFFMSFLSSLIWTPTSTSKRVITNEGIYPSELKCPNTFFAR